MRDCLFSCRGKGSEIAVPGELVRCQGSTQCHIVHRSKTAIRQPQPLEAMVKTRPELLKSKISAAEQAISL